MKTIKSLIHEQISSLKVEIEQNKNRGRWANCLSLSGGISELQSLASNIAALTSAIHSDGEEGCLCGVAPRNKCCPIHGDND